MKKFFISYTTRTNEDKQWARWVEWVLREKLGYETRMQEYHSKIGGNFKMFMDDSLKWADIVVMILTKTYLLSENCREEWVNATELLPLKFDDCQPEGLLKYRVYLDLCGLDENFVEEEIIAGIMGKKPPGANDKPNFKPYANGLANLGDLKPNFPVFAGTPNFAELTNVADAYSKNGDYSQALDSYMKIAKMKESLLGNEHPSTANTYNNVATVYDSLAKYKEALEWYHKALCVYEKKLGKEHPHTAITYNNVAVVYDRMAEYECALEWYQKALDVKVSVLGIEHPDVAITLGNIGAAYHSQGKYEKALTFYIKSYKIRINKLGSEHPNMFITINNIKQTYDTLAISQPFDDWLKQRVAELDDCD